MDINSENQFFTNVNGVIDRMNSEREDLSKLRSIFNSPQSRFILSTNGSSNFLFSNRPSSISSEKNSSLPEAEKKPRIQNIKFLTLEDVLKCSFLDLNFYINSESNPSRTTVTLVDDVPKRVSSTYSTATFLPNKSSIVFIGRLSNDISDIADLSNSLLISDSSASPINPNNSQSETTHFYIWAIDIGQLSSYSFETFSNFNSAHGIKDNVPYSHEKFELDIAHLFGGRFLDFRTGSFGLLPSQAHIIAIAKSVIDWNYRNQHCPSCGTLTWPAQAGFKRVCVNGLMSSDSTENSKSSQSVTNEKSHKTLILEKKLFTEDAFKPCISQTTLNNFTFPRTDAVVIVAIISPDEKHILLARRRNFPPNRYSCISGFIDPAESIEDAVRRESMEEVGLKLSNVTYFASQPWPLPNSLMIGCFAKAQTLEIALDNNELEDAKWFSINDMFNPVKNIEVSSHLKFPRVTANISLDQLESNIKEKKSATGNADNNYKEISDLSKEYMLPPAVAIGYFLVQTWCKSQLESANKL
ncbi:Peroxisomal NADH pyrophosphatase NUDT12 [Smittium culicis]|uniref:NAD(+) diphosphatase n=1 Tax=Smittium culicis TaxID=133412 RepID=A0A1R1XCY9_9FUNG|nr:Peroxisomal NADH pyrophosphatase NUDT12 [Smittium culicis]OMJ18601.1 Peroxisomal NADH pyrophosphatase NUDT12 [Smittium culicis]